MIVDARDFKALSKFKWYAQKGRKTFYAARNISLGGRKHKIVFAHQHIAGTHPGETDHIDGDGLNNRRSNLCSATKSQNRLNASSKLLKKGFRGVSIHPNFAKLKKPWMAKISIDGRRVHLGYFQSPKEAAAAYDVAASGRYKHAKTNRGAR